MKTILFIKETFYHIFMHQFFHKYGIYTFIFLSSWLFYFIMTFGINYFWEDIYFITPTESSVSIEIFKGFKDLFDISSILRIDYTHRPLQHRYWESLPVFFGQSRIAARTFRAIFPAILTLFLFIIIKKTISTKKAIFAIMLFLLTTEILIATLYAQDVMIMMNVITTLALITFFFKYRYSKNINEYLWIFLILFLTRISILLKHEGRIILPIILGYAIVCERTLFKRTSFYILLLFLFLFSIPIGCQLAEQPCMIFGMEQQPTLDYIMNFFIRLPVVINLLGIPSIFLAILSLSNILIRFRQDERTRLFILAFIWFSLELLFVYAARQFTPQMYPRASFQRIDLAAVIFPFILATFAGWQYSSKKIIQILFISLFMFSLFDHSQDIYYWRSGWGEYYDGWEYFRQYFDKKNENSLLVITPASFGAPFYFSTNNKLVVIDPYNIDYVLNYTKTKNYYAVDRLTPGSHSTLTGKLFTNCEIITPTDTTLFGIFKKIFLNKDLQGTFHLCKYNL